MAKSNQAVNVSAATQVAAMKGPFNVRPIELDPFRAGSPYGKHAILDLKGLYTYASIEIITDLPVERLGRVSFERNNKEIIGIDAGYFHKRDRFLKFPVQNKGVSRASLTRLIIPFASEELRTLQGIRRGEYVHQVGETLILKIQVKAKETADPDFPQFKANARVVDYQPVRFFQQRYTETSINHTVVGEQKHDFPLVGANVRLRSMLLDTENNDITKVSIKRDNEIIWESSVEDIKYNQKRYGERQPPGQGVFIDFTLEGFANEQAFIPFAQASLKLVLDKRTTGVVDIKHDFIDVEQLPA
ncbi:P2_N domain-containing protein [Vibrio chagasii]|nr:P2_N domain-containing protein [Vibrio chagasii]CAH7392408.1 P2_N domain-containing protein [Vibrio chagasii]CAH7404597.1 P2_N domain-containing protein [Vibrio chagasii]